MRDASRDDGQEALLGRPDPRDDPPRHPHCRGGTPDRELAGVAFGQHYTDTRGRPDAEAWDDVVREYGDAALCVLLAARTFMWGNALGIPLSALRARLHRRPDPGSSLGSEVGTTLAGCLVTPVGILLGLLDVRHGRPYAPAG